MCFYFKMKLIMDYKTELPSKRKCYHCCTVDYVVYTPMGASYTTCPICHEYANFDEYQYGYGKNKKTNKTLGKLWEYFYDFNTDYEYCHHCQVIFKYELHGVNGCTEDSYTAIFIKKFNFKGNVFNGMPLFTQKELWFVLENPEQFTILKWEHTNQLPVSSRYCSEAFYKQAYL